MDKNILEPPRSAILGRVLGLLSSLNRSQTGAVILSHIKHMLEEHEREHGRIEQAYSSFITMLLEAYAAQVSADGPLLAQIRMLQQRLTPPLTVSELTALHQYVERLSDQVTHLTAFKEEAFSEAFSPLLQAFGVKEGQPAPAATPLRAGSEPAEEAVHPHMAAEAPAPDVEQRVDSAFRQHLKQKRAEFQQIQADFTAQVTQAVAQNERFTALLSRELAVLRTAGGIQGIEQRRTALVAELEKLLEQHRDLTGRFDHISQIMREIDSGNRQLSEELDRVRLLSLTDELTGLPNRRAFLKRLEEEIGRAQRYNSPLALAIMDLDEFKQINDTRGHMVGDMVLRVYANDAMSILRHHDMVARYGGEEFAVLFPNTTQDGAVLALNKVQRQIERIVCKHKGERFHLPTFSAGLSEYQSGENVEELIRRADTAMYKAKRKGRNLIEIADAEPLAASRTDLAEYYSG